MKSLSVPASWIDDRGEICAAVSVDYDHRAGRASPRTVDGARQHFGAWPEPLHVPRTMRSTFVAPATAPAADGPRPGSSARAVTDADRALARGSLMSPGRRFAFAVRSLRFARGASRVAERCEFVDVAVGCGQQAGGGVATRRHRLPLFSAAVSRHHQGATESKVRNYHRPALDPRVSVTSQGVSHRLRDTFDVASSGSTTS